MPATGAENQELDSIFAEIVELGLERQMAELDAVGLTVIPPDKAASAALVERLRAAVLRIGTERTGIEPDTIGGRSHASLEATAGQKGEAWLWRLLFEDRLFEQALMNRAGLALVSYLLGYSAKLSNCSAVIKGPVATGGTQKPLNLHSDNRGIPAPFPSYAQVANVTWALTDYDLANGGVGYLPGSHLLCRQPTPDEALDAVVPVVAPAGSLIVWHGNTWHAPFPRREPGLRISLLFFFCREYLTTQERYGPEVPRALLERNGARFATLMGLADPYGWDQDGPDMKRLAASRSGASLHA